MKSFLLRVAPLTLTLGTLSTIAHATSIDSRLLLGHTLASLQNNAKNLAYPLDITKISDQDRLSDASYATGCEAAGEMSATVDLFVKAESGNITADSLPEKAFLFTNPADALGLNGTLLRDANASKALGASLADIGAALQFLKDTCFYTVGKNVSFSEAKETYLYILQKLGPTILSDLANAQASFDHDSIAP